MNAAARPRVVIVGAGFGGLYCAKALGGLRAQVTLVDRNNYHLFQPLLYQVATGLLDPSQIAYPVRSSMRRVRNARVLMGEVTRVDLGARRVETTAGTLPYDVLVLASGSTSNHFGIEHLAERATGLKDLPEAIHLRATVLRALEAAARTGDERERRRLLTFAVAGAGPTGVEFAGALAELVAHVVPRDYPQLRHDQCSVVLLEARRQVLGTFAPRLGRRAARTLQRKGVTLMLGREVARADEQGLLLRDGTHVDAATIVWTAGVTASRPPGTEGLGRTSSGRIPVSDTLTVAGHPEVFVVGDLAELSQHGSPLGMLAAVAIQEGRHVAEVLRARAQHTPEPPFRYFDKGTMATIGRGAAVAELGPVHIEGFIGWLMWLGLHLIYIAGFRNRAVVMLSWAWNFFFFERGVRLILEPARDDGDAQEDAHAATQAG